MGGGEGKEGASEKVGGERRQTLSSDFLNECGVDRSATENKRLGLPGRG